MKRSRRATPPALMTKPPSFLRPTAAMPSGLEEEDMLDLDEDEPAAAATEVAATEEDEGDEEEVEDSEEVEPEVIYPALVSEFVDVTGDMAREWLETMGRNRSLRKERVVEFARDMLNDSWHQTGEAIKFDIYGSLVDGQHRCEAVALASKTKPDLVLKNVLVVRGVQPEAQMVMDTNTRRSSSDQLRIAGFDNHAALAAAAKWLVIWDRDVLYADRLLKSVTHAEIMEYVVANPQLKELVRHTMRNLNKHIDIPSGYVCAGYYICWKIDPDAADEFFARMADGVMLASDSPIKALRDRLRDLKADRSSLPGDLYLSLIIRTWNSYRKGTPVRRLQVWKDKQPIRCPKPI